MDARLITEDAVPWPRFLRDRRGLFGDAEPQDLVVAAHDLLDLEEHAVDVAHPPERGVLLPVAAGALELQGSELELDDVPFVGMAAAPLDGGMGADLLGPAGASAHGLAPVLAVLRGEGDGAASPPVAGSLRWPPSRCLRITWSTVGWSPSAPSRTILAERPVRTSRQTSGKIASPRRARAPSPESTRAIMMQARRLGPCLATPSSPSSRTMSTTTSASSRATPDLARVMATSVSRS